VTRQIADTTLFRVETLFAIAYIEEQTDRVPYGLEIKRELERPYRYGEDVNHGRLYPNLDRLVGAGLLEKGRVDDRTNRYSLTEAGRDRLEAIVADRRYDLGVGEEPAWRRD
jgi:DNA-binding PadR family transcriptional regulator